MTEASNFIFQIRKLSLRYCVVIQGHTGAKIQTQVLRLLNPVFSSMPHWVHGPLNGPRENFGKHGWYQLERCLVFGRNDEEDAGGQPCSSVPKGGLGPLPTAMLGP